MGSFQSKNNLIENKSTTYYHCPKCNRSYKYKIFQMIHILHCKGYNYTALFIN